ncbi:MAG: DinB family protein [Alphaproteobacteria bacterium]
MATSLLAHFRMLARYNRLANERLYEASAGLPDGERKRDRKGFFRSIHGTLNHILVGDRIWLGRFEGKAMPSTDLDAILYEDFDALRIARAAEDRRIEAFAAGLTDDVLAGSFRYVNNEGRDLEDPAVLIVAHFFNYQTHHRGQVHDMLSQAGARMPVLDMHRVIRP